MHNRVSYKMFIGTDLSDHGGQAGFVLPEV